MRNILQYPEISKLLGVHQKLPFERIFNYLEEKNLIYRHHEWSYLNNPYVVDGCKSKKNIKIEEKNRIAEESCGVL